MAKIIPNTKRERVTLIDEVDSTLTYLGIAKLGAATSEAHWQIRRLLKTDTVTSIQYADGDRRFNNIWDNRTSLTYTN